MTTLMQSIKTKLMVLEDDYKVLPGHGPFTSIGMEKKYNQFRANFL
jgi:glyoxylase-like metal-dependent hydrolase (beta-lactamase superfamily II)